MLRNWVAKHLVFECAKDRSELANHPLHVVRLYSTTGKGQSATCKGMVNLPNIDFNPMFMFRSWLAKQHVF